MVSAKNVLMLINFYCVLGNFIESKPNWIYEIISVEVINETPDILKVEGQRTRVARGIYTTSGTIDIKQDLTDDLHLSGIMFYSPTGSSNYVKTPFEVPEMPLSEFVNTLYKDMLMESLMECVDILKKLETKFEPPLTKAFVTYNNCKVSTDKMPTRLRRGYYKLVLKVLKQANTTVIYTVNIENEL